MTAERRPTADDKSSEGRLRVSKTYKMFIGGAFIRSESGRYFQVRSAGNTSGADLDVVNVSEASRKDVRDAVVAARGAFAKWAGRTAYNRGQILYRLAETLEGRFDELVLCLERGGTSLEHAKCEVAATIDRTVYYAGFADKIASVMSSANAVAGPFLAFSEPEPMGVVGVVSPDAPSLIGLFSGVLPAIVSGNTVVVVASSTDPRTSIVASECIATSDVPGGVVNILTGFAKDLAPQLARHRDVDALVAWVSDAELRAALEHDASDNMKRTAVAAPLARDAWFASGTGQGLSHIERFVETKSVWHPRGV